MKNALEVPNLAVVTTVGNQVEADDERRHHGPLHDPAT